MYRLRKISLKGKFLIWGWSFLAYEGRRAPESRHRAYRFGERGATRYCRGESLPLLLGRSTHQMVLFALLGIRDSRFSFSPTQVFHFIAAALIIRAFAQIVAACSYQKEARCAAHKGVRDGTQADRIGSFLVRRRVVHICAFSHNLFIWKLAFKLKFCNNFTKI